MDRTEISEIFCGAVDTIISARLKELSYDITQSCIIINNDSKRQGKYIVSDGSVNFEAYSQIKTLEVNDNVMVTIPNGNYSSRKVIIAKIEPEVPETSIYTSQLDLMRIFTDDIVSTHQIEASENPGLLANEDNSSSYIHLYTLENKRGDLSGYTRLGIKADFQSLLNNADVVQGTYGLKIYVYSTLPSAPGQIKKDGIYELYLNSSEMIGNPYNFSVPFTQEKVIDISMIENIQKIEIFFYQNGDFKNSDNNLIGWQSVDYTIGLSPEKIPNNLYAQNVKLFLGYEADGIEKDRIVINCLDSSIYSYADYNLETGVGPAKRLQLKWLHRFEDLNKYELLDMNSLEKLGIQLKWFRYNLNAKQVDKYAGRGWEEIPVAGDLFSCTFTPDRNLSEEKIMAIGYKINITYESSNTLMDNFEYLEEYTNLMSHRYEGTYESIGKISEEEFKGATQTYYIKENETFITPNDYIPDRYYYIYKPNYGTDEEFQAELEKLKYKYLDSIESVETYRSEILTLKNSTQVYDSVTFNASSALSIYYEDNSEGNYFIYDSNGKLLNSGDGRGFERRMRAVYQGKEITPDLGTLDYIAWYLPQGPSAKSMLLNTDTYYTKDRGQVSKTPETYQNTQYVCIKRYPSTSDGSLNTWQSYSINNTWNSAYTNNLIRCEVSIDGVKYEASDTMRFGKAGTQGTNTTLILEMQDNYNSIVIPTPTNADGEKVQYCVVGTVYDTKGTLLSGSFGEWEWSWKTPMIKDENDQPIINIVEDTNNKSRIYLETNLQSLNEVQNGYYGILQGSYKQTNGVKLTAYLNIPLRRAEYVYIEGAQEISYNSSGKPSYYADAYKLFSINEITGFFEEISDTKWDVVHNIDCNILDENGEKVINEETGLEITSQMSKDYIPKLNDIYKDGKTYKGLSAPSLYASGYDEICIVCSSQTQGEYLSIGKLDMVNFTKNTYYYKDIEDTYQLATSYIPDTEYYKFISDILWIQPLLITNSQHDYALLNNWDGTLMTDEGNGVVMSTIVGAGRKNEDNTFSGVLMGEVQDITDISEGGSFVLAAAPGKLSRRDFEAGTYYYKDVNNNYTEAIVYDNTIAYYTLRPVTGLYGFQNGAISFSLKDNGVATFGKANRGQIIIDGNESTLTSRGYRTSGDGMLLDLDDGKLIIKDDGQLKFQLSPSEPYLMVSGYSETNPMIYIGGEECYLQSEGKSLGAMGTKLDLVKGVLDISGTGGKVLLSGQESDPFFKVTTREGATLIHMDTDGYYLQSSGFEADSAIRKTDDALALDIYHEKEYVPIILNKQLFEERYFIDSDDIIISRYFIYNPSTKKYIGLGPNDTFNKNQNYYRQGDQLNVIFGYEYTTNSCNLYYLNYNEDDETYTVGDLVDVYEEDQDGNFKYPILRQIVEYIEQPNYISMGLIGEDDFNNNEYFINQDNQFISTKSTDDEGNLLYPYNPDVEYYIFDGYSYHEDVIPLPDYEDQDKVISYMIQRYVDTTLTPVKAETVPSGMRLDLVDGRIEGYNLKLIGTKLKVDEETQQATVVNRLIINTEDDTTPVQVGGNFNINWDGSLTCTKVKYITNKGAIPELPASKSVYGADSVAYGDTVIDIGNFQLYDNGSVQDLTVNGILDASNWGDIFLKHGVSRSEFFDYTISEEGTIIWGESKYLLKSEGNDRYLSIHQFNQKLKEYVLINDLDTHMSTTETITKLQTDIGVLQQNIIDLQAQIDELKNPIETP